MEIGFELAEARSGAVLTAAPLHQASPPTDVEQRSRRDSEVVELRPTDMSPMRTVTPRRSTYGTVVKPIIDRAAGVVGVAVAAIPMAATAAVILGTIGRPILFRQRRIGRDGEVFEVLKFRTMRPDRRDQRLDVIHDRRETHKSSRDPRHTRVGRFLRRYSLDELPQLINVAGGDMSLVGPRPELESVVQNYRPGLDQRHLVKPGLTGLWQISARGDGPMHENGEWDLEYVEQVSFLTDLKILLKTPAAMFGDNAGT
jgi:lipopolysaccharide/colanic/teichoic acid biosynthesis glycosyltransferase